MDLFRENRKYIGNLSFDLLDKHKRIVLTIHFINRLQFHRVPISTTRSNLSGMNNIKNTIMTIMAEGVKYHQ